jgi:uncharacterized protein YdeI (YjbR/CyaY-like superfamily)
MGTRDPRVDAYIAQAGEFAQPILRWLRDVVHRHCPEVEESIKWGFPHFLHHGMLCSMAAFKQHCSFGFWKGTLFVVDSRNDEAMGQFGRITSLENAPDEKLLAGYIRQAMQFNESGTKPARGSKDAAPRAPAQVPDDLAAALKNNRKAAAVFEGFSNTNRREYIEWITEAKRAETRAKRLAQTLEWLAEGKARNWKYQDC